MSSLRNFSRLLLRLNYPRLPSSFHPRLITPSRFLCGYGYGYGYGYTRPIQRYKYTCRCNINPHRTISNSTGSKSQADLLVEELQELYETATDEFEIATDSTNGATIYAASDRESARDALDDLLAVFSLYTTDLATTAESHAPMQAPMESRGRMVATSFDPADIPPEVREEVQRRIGGRVGELREAVEELEGRAGAE